ncbi:poly(A)-specific ribonuclease [Actinomortierella wolfii]|nr:poly(A)-specific ribonuclease [Actinomortierella wolfii]
MKTDVDTEVVVMKKSRLLVCGSTGGELILQDPRSLTVEHRIQAHTGTISDLDVSGNLIVTCGFSERQGNLIIDPLVKVYDMRTMRSLTPIPFPNGPSFLKMHPKLSTTVCIASSTGQFQMCDVGNLSHGIQFYQVNTTSYLTSFDMSYSGEMVAMGDAGNVVHVWGDKAEPKMNHFSNPVEMPTIQIPPTLTVNDNDPLSSIGMPYYREQLLSAWPAKTVFNVGRKSQPIPSAILDNMKMIDFVGYAPNPGTHLRNQAPSLPKSNIRDTPKFRSEQQKELFWGRRKSSGVRSLDNGEEEEQDLTTGKMPKYYKRVEIKYSKFGVEDFDFGFYNKTKFGGLETHIANSYCNALLQVLFFTPLLRALLKHHIGLACPRENCLSCELGFLFRMLEDSNGQNCQARNFLRAFSTIPQASALGLFEPEAPDAKTPYSSLIQNFNRFLLEQLHQESSLEKPIVGGTLPFPPSAAATSTTVPSAAAQVSGEAADGAATAALQQQDTQQQHILHGLIPPSPVQEIFGMKTASTNVCGHCGFEEERITYPFVLDLMWPKGPSSAASNALKLSKHSSSGRSGGGGSGGGSSSASTTSFAEIMRMSLCRETQSRGWCAACQQYQPATTKKTLLGAPHVLSINTGAGAGSGVTAPASIGRNLAADPVLASNMFIDESGKDHHWLPRMFTLIIKDKDVEILENNNGEDLDSEGTIATYELYSVVSSIQQAGEVAHLVAHVKDDGADAVANPSLSPWYIFNDFLVKNVAENEATQFPVTWKTPCIFYYARKDNRNPTPLNQLIDTAVALDTSILHMDISISKHRDPKYIFYKLLKPDEIKPGERMLIGIDTEFVTLSREETEIRSDGTKSLLRPPRMSLARVSVLRGNEGAMEYTPFIDDYIATTEPVVDYLTEFSGIQPGDLDPNKSKHTLVPLKVAYKRLRTLVDMGCIFVGHGLRQDFRIINILVPPEQVQDTVDIFHIKNRQRKISLRFLVWYLLHEDIQSESHDSIEDARAALAIYHKYLQLKQNGLFEEVLEDIYSEGRRTNWKPIPGQFPQPWPRSGTPSSASTSTFLSPSRPGTPALSNQSQQPHMPQATPGQQQQQQAPSPHPLSQTQSHPGGMNLAHQHLQQQQQQQQQQAMMSQMPLYHHPHHPLHQPPRQNQAVLTGHLQHHSLQPQPLHHVPSQTHPMMYHPTFQGAPGQMPPHPQGYPNGAQRPYNPNTSNQY